LTFEAFLFPIFNVLATEIKILIKKINGCIKNSQNNIYLFFLYMVSLILLYHFQVLL
jgi:hypothetical protein